MKSREKTKWRQGSICVECSMVLPLFLIFTLVLFSLLEMIQLHGKINAALHASARELSAYSYTLGETGKEWSAPEEKVIGLGGAETFIRGRMLTILGKEWFENSLIVGKEAGLHFLRSGMDWEAQEIELIVTYKVRPYITVSNLGSLKLMNRCRVKMWTGFPLPDEEGIYVYVTDTGMAYHMSPYCSYLNPSIHSAAWEDVEKMRNLDRGKYYSCERCFNRTETERLGYVYVTDYGDRYHTSMCCKSLKRTVTKIPITEKGNRHKCHKCGGE